MTPKAGPAEQLILDLEDLAQLTPWTSRELRRWLCTPDGDVVTKAYTGTTARLTFPGGIHVDAVRRAENAGWVVYRLHFDAAVAEWLRAGRPIPPPPLALEQETRA